MHLSIIQALLLLALVLRPSTAQQEGDVRLIGGPTEYQGTVGIYHNGEWGTICDDSWQYRDADVICRQLGFERSYRTYYRAFYGQGPGPIFVDGINCPRDAESVLDCEPCKSQRWGKGDCDKREDAGVDCLRKVPRKPLKMDVRLSCPGCAQFGTCTTCAKKRHPSPTDCSVQSTVEGIVFANYNDEWRPVSGEGWDEKDSQVVCGELGYPLALPVPSLYELWTNWDGDFLQDCMGEGALFNRSSYPKCDLVSEGSGAGLCTSEEAEENDKFRDQLRQTFLKKVQCEGNERRLLDCYFPEFGPHDSPSLKVAAVRCAFRPHQNCAEEAEGTTSEVRQN